MGSSIPFCVSFGHLEQQASGHPWARESTNLISNKRPKLLKLHPNAPLESRADFGTPDPGWEIHGKKIAALGCRQLIFWSNRPTGVRLDGGCEMEEQGIWLVQAASSLSGAQQQQVIKLQEIFVRF